MKRGTPHHPKLDHLASLLQLSRWGAVGVLETLWHFAQSFCRRGDIGRYTDEEVARWLGWTGDAGELVRALAQSRWLDPCPCHRYRLHDWPDHADQAVTRTEEVKRHGFLECYSVASSRPLASSSGPLARPSGSAEAFQPAVAVAVPLPLPEPLPLPAAPAPAAAPVADEAAWSRVLTNVARKVPAQVYATWFEPTRALQGDPGELRVGVPSTAFVTWIGRNYRTVLDEAMTAAGLGKTRLSLVPQEKPP